METNKNDLTTMFIIYQTAHVDELKKYFKNRPEEKESFLAVALSMDIEERMLKEGIPFISAGSYRTLSADQLSVEDQMLDNFFSDSRWDEFVYRDIHLPKIFRFMFQAYLQLVRYHAQLFIKITAAYPGIKEIRIFPPSEVISRTYGTLASREINVVVDCAKRIADIRNIRMTVIPLSIAIVSINNSSRAIIFSVKRMMFGLALKVWNWMMIVLRPSSSPRFLVSDHWRNIQSSVRFFEKGEIIFLDRSEIRNISLRELFRYRMRFVHITDFLPWKSRKRIQEDSSRFQHAWRLMEKDIPRIFSWNGYSFDKLLFSAIDDITQDFTRILSQIEGTYSMYRRLHPHVVELRASVSKQTHFSILALVAKKCGIPSVELQHGLEYLGPGSWSRNHEAEYIAVYGDLVKKELMSLGYIEKNLVTIGSPRFDLNIEHMARYERKKREGKGQGKFTVLCIAPDIRIFEIYDSYSAHDYLMSCARALEENKNNVHIIVKMRSGPANEGQLRSIVNRAFSGFSHEIVHNESLVSACENANVAISCFSTALLEVLQFGIPVIIPALNPVDEQIVKFHFSSYGEAGAVTMIYDSAAFSEALFQFIRNPDKIREAEGKIRSFMVRNFCFDGKSSERYATLISEIARRR